jgi:t-SNARE complex subunit (syntaxin)
LVLILIEITPQDLMQEAPKLTENQKQTLNAAYAEASDTHQDILELERALNEIHQLFVDFAVSSRFNLSADKIADNFI